MRQQSWSRLELKYGFHTIYVSALSWWTRVALSHPNSKKEGCCLLVSHRPLAWIDYNCGSNYGVKRSVDHSESPQNSRMALLMLAARRGSKTALEMAVLVRS